MKNNKRDFIILAVCAILITVVCLGVIVAMVAPLEDLPDLIPDIPSIKPDRTETAYNVELKLFGPTDDMSTYELKGNETLTVNVQASSGYVLPDKIVVDGAKYTWTKLSYDTGVLIVYEPFKDVTIDIQAFNTIDIDIQLTGTGYIDLVNHADSITFGETVVFEFDYSDGYIISYDHEECFDVTEEYDGSYLKLTVTWNGNIPADGVIDLHVDSNVETTSGNPVLGNEVGLYTTGCDHCAASSDQPYTVGYVIGSTVEILHDLTPGYIVDYILVRDEASLNELCRLSSEHFEVTDDGISFCIPYEMLPNQEYSIIVQPVCVLQN